jgi:hypothetical protein
MSSGEQGQGPKGGSSSFKSKTCKASRARPHSRTGSRVHVAHPRSAQHHQVTACAARPCSAPRPTGKRQTPHPPPPPRRWSRVRPPWSPSRGESPRRRRQGGSPARGPHARRAAAETATWRSRGCACARRRRQVTLPAWRAENCRTACASGVKVRTPTARCFHSARKEGTRCCRASFPARFLGSRRDGQAAKTGLGRHTVAPVAMICEARIR